MELHSTLNSAIRLLLVRKGAQARTTRLGEHTVHFYDVKGTGEGPPVVFVHGLGGTAHNFARIVLPLRQRFSRLLMMDFPGCGFSALPDSGPMPYQKMVDLLATFLDEVVGEPVFLIGNSLGGAMSLHLATLKPEKLAALGLIAPAGATLPEGRLAELVKSLAVTNKAQARALASRLFHRPGVYPYLFANEVLRVYNEPAVKSLCEEAISIPPLTAEALAALKMPVLLLWGGSERLLPFEGIDFFRTAMPKHACVEIVDGFGHVPQLEKPAAVVKKIVEFADGCGLGVSRPDSARRSA